MEITQLNLRHLSAVAEISRLGSISAAAQSVHLTQPAITQALGKLECLLGLSLFNRTPTGMTSTAASALLVPRIVAAHDYIASPRVTMTQLRAFIALARAGSYKSAAYVTGLAQASLHRAVTELSLALARTLVERRGQGLVLTAYGRQTARAFRLALAELEAGLSELMALKGRETGYIAIGAMPLARARILPKAVAAFHHLHPDVEIKIAEGAHAELLEPLRDGDLDLLIGALRDTSPGDDVVQQQLFEDRPVVLGRTGHPLADGKSDVERFSAYPWIISAPGTPLRTQLERMFTEAGIGPPHVPIECGSVITIRQILLESDFLTLLSTDQVAVELEAGWLTKICDVPIDLVRVIGITTRTSWVPTRKQQTFLELIAQIAVANFA